MVGVWCPKISHDPTTTICLIQTYPSNNPMLRGRWLHQQHSHVNQTHHNHSSPHHHHPIRTYPTQGYPFSTRPTLQASCPMSRHSFNSRTSRPQLLRRRLRFVPWRLYLSYASRALFCHLGEPITPGRWVTSLTQYWIVLGSIGRVAKKLVRMRF